MEFENDIFISYAHVDDQALVEGHKGWISAFHRALEIRLAQLMGKQARIWRDPKLQGNDVFGDRLVERLPRVALLLSVLSPRYVNSEWCMRELNEFWNASAATGGMRIGDKLRVFKVVKTPIPLDRQPERLQEVLGYEFYITDSETGRPRELAQDSDPELQKHYWAKLDDLAHDISDMLEAMAGQQAPTAAAGGHSAMVYLAETSFDLRDERDSIKRELQGHGHVVLPDRPLPLIGPDCESLVREQMARCQMSIHLIGTNYGIVPEGSTESIVVMQNELAIERGAGGDFSRLIWLPPDLDSEDERQLEFIDHLQTDARIQEGADMFQVLLEDFKTAIHKRLEPPEPEEEAPAEAPGAGFDGDGDGDDLSRVYLICDQRDLDHTMGLEDFLFDAGFEVIVPVFEGDEAQVRRDHEENLSICDAVLVYYGEGNELWLRRKLRELQKSAAFGRQKPISAKAIYVAPPATPQKRRLRTREALVVEQSGDAFAADSLQPFVQMIEAG